MRWARNLIALIVVSAAAAFAWWWFFGRIPAHQLKQAIQGQATAQVAAGRAGAQLDTERITTRGATRERLIIERREQAVEAVRSAQGADTPLSDDFVERFNRGMRNLDSDPAGGRGDQLR